ncbi:MAG: aminoacyl-tRNA hydrolase [Flavobacteriaceae bacterium]|nr:aminoacyl-tRNA hydrolase [Flavobacteriaceae bacterium]
MKKYLIVGLGNIGSKYENTRHNIGFKILDKIAKNKKINWETKKLGDLSRFRYKGRTFILLKPNTFMNLSGKAIKYWQNIEKIPLENILIVTDDLNLPFGSIRLKTKGSAGGHNGLINTIDYLQTQNFSRLRFGVGAEYRKGNQIDYVLGEWNDEEQGILTERIEKSTKAITSFAMAGIANTMSDFNGK